MPVAFTARQIGCETTSPAYFPSPKGVHSAEQRICYRFVLYSGELPMAPSG